MIKISLKNCETYSAILKKAYKDGDGFYSKVNKILAAESIEISKSTFYRVVKKLDMKNIPTRNKDLKDLRVFLKSNKTSEKTIEELLELLDEKGFKKGDVSYNEFDLRSRLKKYGLSFKKKDLSKKVYTNSKRITSKYSYAFKDLKAILEKNKDLKLDRD